MSAAKSLEIKELPYQPDALLTRFAPLASLPWAMLLHSGSAQHAHNRFDILVADPRITLTTRGHLTEITRQNGQTDVLSDDPFLLLQRELENSGLHAEVNPALPFRAALWACWVMILVVR